MKYVYLIPVFSLLFIFSVVSNASADSKNGKYIIFTMDDNPVGQYNFAKPVLDTYGYHASFMVVCNWVNHGNNPNRMSWEQIADLAADGQDIESHSMTHPDLTKLTLAQLQYEIAGSKDCLHSHGYNVTAFAYPRNLGSENSTVVNVVSNNYDVAKSFGSQGVYWFLSCQSYQAPRNQTNCSTYNSTGFLQYATQYSVRMYSIDDLEKGNNYTDSIVYSKFVNWIENQTQYNIKGQINAIPVVTVHEIVDPLTQSYWLHTNQVLFSKIVNFLHDNNYTVLTLKDLGYDNKTHMMYVKPLQSKPTMDPIVKLNKIKWPKAGSLFTINGTLTDDNGKPLPNQTVLFSGNGDIGRLPVKTDKNGVFVSTGFAPSLNLSKKWNNFQINAIHMCDTNSTSTISIQYFAVN